MWFGRVFEHGFDLSAVSSATVRQALPHLLLTDWRMKKRWSDFDAITRDLHRDILQSYVQNGIAPDISELDQSRLHDLVERDLVVVAQGKISSAYPFSSHPTTHNVRIYQRQIFCVCAIDALGVGAMIGEAVDVSLKCAICAVSIDLQTTGDGLGNSASAPDTATIWAGIVEIDGCAADTQCQSMLAFCSAAHLCDWQSKADDRQQGFAFTLEQAVQAGAAIFRPFL